MQDLIIGIYYVLWFMNILCTITRKNVKIISWMTFSLMFFIFVLNGATEGDAQIYKADYESGSYGDECVEFGYIYFVSFFREIGIVDFNWWLVCVFALTNWLLYKGISYYTSSFHAIFSVVMGYIWICQSQGLRFYIACSLFFFGIHYLSDKKYKKYLIVTLLASCVHRTILFMLIYPILLWMNGGLKNRGIINRDNMGKYVLALCSVFSLLLYIAQGIPGIENILVLIKIFSAESANKLLAYGSSVTRFGGLAYIFIYLIMLIGVIYMSVKLQNLSNVNNIRKICFIRDFFYITAIFCPLLVIHVEFSRLLIVPALLYGVMVSMYNKGNTNDNGGRYIFTFNNENIVCALLFFLSVIAWSMPTFLGMIHYRLTIEFAIENLLLFH